MTTRTGKIARLPRTIRDQLNRHLDNGAPGPQLLKWLNNLAEVKQMLKTHFDAQPVNKQNLSDWKQGGFRDWLLRQEALELAMCMAGDTAELKESAANAAASISDTMAQWYATRLLLAARALVEGGNEPVDSDRMRRMLHDLAILRRGDHQAERIRLARDKYELTRVKTSAEKEEEFWKRVQLPNFPEKLKQHQEEEERRAKKEDADWDEIIRLMFGDKPEHIIKAEEAGDYDSLFDSPGPKDASSLSVKPGQGQSSQLN